MNNIYLAGASGRLGREIQASAATKNLKLHPLARADLSVFSKILSNREPSSAKSILLDVSLPEGTIALTDSLLAGDCKGLRAFIIGSTGHTQETLKKIEQLSQKLPVILSSNFSRGVFLFEEILKARTTSGALVADLARTLGFDLALWESHHTKKLDAPSGTAKTLAEAAQLSPERIASSRVGSVVGEHSLLFSQEAEELRLTHTAHARSLFAEGALSLCERLFERNLKCRMYSMSEALNELISIGK
jgi:4-hydroxy-tetrahydrodipicolinate reductase